MGNNFDFKKFFKSFFPLFAIAALLPFLLAIVITPTRLSLLTQADQKPNLRIWFDPASAGGTVNKPIKLKINADFDSTTKIIPSLSVSLTGDSPSLFTSPSAFVYNKPFQGTVTLGTVEIVPKSPGSYTLDIPVDKVVTSLNDEVNITTSPSKIFVGN